MTEEGAEEKGDESEKGKKKKKEKKPKVPKEKKPKGPPCYETLSAGLDLANRDGKAINADVSVSIYYSFRKIESLLGKRAYIYYDFTPLI